MIDVLKNMTLKNEIAILLSWKYPKSEMGYCVEIATQILNTIVEKLPEKPTKASDMKFGNVDAYIGYSQCLDDIISLLTK